MRIEHRVMSPEEISAAYRRLERQQAERRRAAIVAAVILAVGILAGLIGFWVLAAKGVQP